MSSRRQLIVSNTLLLYGRMLFTMWLNLWTTRLTLQHLGVDDLGVYGIVGSLLVNGLSSEVLDSLGEFLCDLVQRVVFVDRQREHYFL